LFGALTNGSPVRLAISAAAASAKPGAELIPVPTAVPPSASRYSRYNYPVLVDFLKSLKTKSFTIDGEITALDENGRSSFQLLQGFGKARHTPLLYYAFDLLALDCAFNPNPEIGLSAGSLKAGSGARSQGGTPDPQERVPATPANFYPQRIPLKALGPIVVPSTVQVRPIGRFLLHASISAV